MTNDNPIKNWRHFRMIWRALPVKITLWLIWSLPYYLWWFLVGVWTGLTNPKHPRS